MYLYYISCLRYTVLAGNPRIIVAVYNWRMLVVLELKDLGVQVHAE